MKATAEMSAELKTQFKDWFLWHGLDTPMPDSLAGEAIHFPQEYGEAYDEFLEYGWRQE